MPHRLAIRARMARPAIAAPSSMNTEEGIHCGVSHREPAPPPAGLRVAEPAHGELEMSVTNRSKRPYRGALRVCPESQPFPGAHRRIASSGRPAMQAFSGDPDMSRTTNGYDCHSGVGLLLPCAMPQPSPSARPARRNPCMRMPVACTAPEGPPSCLSDGSRRRTRLFRWRTTKEGGNHDCSYVAHRDPETHCGCNGSEHRFNCPQCFQVAKYLRTQRRLPPIS